jgi:hypothetical protein
MGRSRDGTLKYEDWSFRVKGFDKALTVEVRLDINKDVHFIASMPDGTKLTETDISRLRSAVDDKMRGIETYAWEKVLFVSVKGEYKSHHQVESKDAEVNMEWAIWWRAARSDGHTVWKREENTHHIEYNGPMYYDPDHGRILPYTEAGEAFLRAAADSIRALRKKLEEFFQSDELQLRIEQNTLPLLPPA